MVCISSSSIKVKVLQKKKRQNEYRRKRKCVYLFYEGNVEKAERETRKSLIFCHNRLATFHPLLDTLVLNLPFQYYKGNINRKKILAKIRFKKKNDSLVPKYRILYEKA